MDLFQHFRRLTQTDDREKVGGNQKRKHRCVVARTKHGADHAHRLGGIAVTVRHKVSVGVSVRRWK